MHSLALERSGLNQEPVASVIYASTMQLLSVHPEIPVSQREGTYAQMLVSNYHSPLKGTRVFFSEMPDYRSLAQKQESELE